MASGILIIQRYPWVIPLEGREVIWGGCRWRFRKGVPIPFGPEEHPNALPNEQWASVPDASRLFDLRIKLLRVAVEDGRIRCRRFLESSGPGKPAVYVALMDVAALRVGRQGHPRAKSVRDEPTVGAVLFIKGLPVPIRVTAAMRRGVWGTRRR